MTDFWSFLLQTLTAAGAAALVLAVKALFRDKLSPRWQFAVWGVLALAILLPAGGGGRYVLLNWPLLVETLKTLLTGDCTITRVGLPIPLPALALPTRWDGWLFLLYWVGCILLLGKYLLSYLHLRSALRKGVPAGAEMTARLAGTAEKYGLPTCRAVEVEGLSSAFLCGLLSPVLALPAGEEVDEKVLLHELLHLKYHDTAWGVLICLLRCLHWCDLLLWYGADRAGNDLEALCDQRVLERLEGEARRDYGRILLGMAAGKYARSPGTSNLSGGGENIRRRIEAIARFKRYPAGMGLVSVCLLVSLAVPVAAGNFSDSFPDLPGSGKISQTAALAAGRTVTCTSAAGAFDTYAKAVLTQNAAYRAACTPVGELEGLTDRVGEEGLPWLPALAAPIATWNGYQVYNVCPAGEEAYEGLLVVELERGPEDVLWDGVTAHRWIACQPLRAEREGVRWVIRPLGEFTVQQRDERVCGDLSLPALVYEGASGDLTFRMHHQTVSSVPSSTDNSSGPFWDTGSFDATPKPGGAFTCTSYSWVTATLADGAEGPSSLGLSIAPWEDLSKPRPQLLMLESGSWNDSRAGAIHRDPAKDWSDPVHLLLSFGGDADSSLPPEAYAADVYLEGEKTAELTLLPLEGGPQ